MDSKTSEWRPGPNVCRCCLTEGCYKDISTEYFWMGKREIYAEMLSDTFNVSIAYSQTGGPNSNSRLICEPCISRLRDATEFKRQVQDCEKTFMQHLDPGSSAMIEISGDPIHAEKSVKLEQVKLEKLESDDDFGFGGCDDDDDDDDDLDDQPLTKLASKVPKKEAVDLLDLLDNSQITVKRKVAAKGKSATAPPPTKKTKVVTVNKQPAKPSASKQTVAAKPVEKKKKDDEHTEGTGNTVRNEKSTFRASRLDTNAKYNVVLQNIITILRNTTAYPIRYHGESYRCYFCDSNFDDPALYRVHVDSDHSKIDKTIIVKRYTTQLRVDITDLRCLICGKDYPNLETVAQHLNDEHKKIINEKEGLGLIPLKLKKDNYVCVVCGKKYTGYIGLSLHVGSHYCRMICYICGQKFGNAVSVKNHIDRKHLNKCKFCKKTFTTAEARVEHVRTNKTCHPFPCSMCKERYLSWENKIDHMEKIHTIKRKENSCANCGKVFGSRTQLYFHFKESHTDDYKCEVCKKSFSTKRNLKEHMSEHTGLRPFQCNDCLKTFVREKNFRSHQKIHDDSKKQACTVCTKVFVEKSKLKIHTRKLHRDVYDLLYPSKHK